MKKCPNCQATARQNKASKTDAGSQRCWCMHCQRKYTPAPKHHGYPESLRKRAAEMYVDGGNLRRIAHHLKVSPQTVSLWVPEVAGGTANAPVPQEAEMDEIFTFIGDKKQNLHSDHCKS